MTIPGTTAPAARQVPARRGIRFPSFPYAVFLKSGFGIESLLIEIDHIYSFGSHLLIEPGAQSLRSGLGAYVAQLSQLFFSYVFDEVAWLASQLDARLGGLRRSSGLQLQCHPVLHDSAIGSGRKLQCL